MYISNDELLVIPIDEVEDRGYNPGDLLGDKLDSISKQLVEDYNCENGSDYKFISVFGLIKKRLIIKVEQ